MNGVRSFGVIGIILRASCGRDRNFYGGVLQKSYKLIVVDTGIATDRRMVCPTLQLHIITLTVNHLSMYHPRSLLPSVMMPINGGDELYVNADTTYVSSSSY
jgi:hypothetical protein